MSLDVFKGYQLPVSSRIDLGRTSIYCCSSVLSRGCFQALVRRQVRQQTNLVPRVFSLFKMAVAREKTLAHSRSRVSNEDGDVFKMAAAAKRVRRTGYEMWLR